jgi:4-hydroxybenzoate polyprenyltransferase
MFLLLLGFLVLLPLWARTRRKRIFFTLPIATSALFFLVLSWGWLASRRATLATWTRVLPSVSL